MFDPADKFWLSPAEVDNRDLYYHNAPKCRLQAAHVNGVSRARDVSTDLPTTPGENDYYYVRASQVDGQYAWSSPIWIALD